MVSLRGRPQADAALTPAAPLRIASADPHDCSVQACTHLPNVTTSGFKWRSTCAVGAGLPSACAAGYRLLPWSPELLDEHAEVKYLSFRDELDAVVFPCLGELTSCQRLMQEISERDGFVPEATWLAIYAPAGARYSEPCGTIQAIRTAAEGRTFRTSASRPTTAAVAWVQRSSMPR